MHGQTTTRLETKPRPRPRRNNAIDRDMHESKTVPIPSARDKRHCWGTRPRTDHRNQKEPKKRITKETTRIKKKDRNPIPKRIMGAAIPSMPSTSLHCFLQTFRVSVIHPKRSRQTTGGTHGSPTREPPRAHRVAYPEVQLGERQSQETAGYSVCRAGEKRGRARCIARTRSEGWV